MDKNSLSNKLKEFGLNTKQEYMTKPFSRNMSLLTQTEQNKLSNGGYTCKRYISYQVA